MLVRHRNGPRATYRHATDETVADFAGRLVALGPADDPDSPDVQPRLAAPVRGDIDLPDAAQVYALRRSHARAAAQFLDVWTKARDSQLDSIAQAHRRVRRRAPWLAGEKE